MSKLQQSYLEILKIELDALISPTSEGTNEMVENPIQPTTETSAIRISPSVSSFTSLPEPPAQIRYSV